MDHLSIGEFARASGLTAKALRLYDELDLLAPAHVEPANGYRYYSHDQLDRAHLVARLRLVGMPLARIRSVLGLPGPAAAAELASYWRQVLADNATRQEIVQSLVLELRARESTMHEPTSHTLSAAVRHGQGGRERQQDAAYAGTSLFAVADGYGDGEAAQAVVAAVAELDGQRPGPDAEAELDLAVTSAAAGTTGRKGGTTLTTLWVGDGRALAAHVGDARLVRARNGAVTRLTRDHTLVASLIEEGRLTEDEARAHPHRLLLNRALQDGRIVAGDPGDLRTGSADVREVDVRSGDRLVLVTDGVHTVVDPGGLHEVLSSGRDAADVADRVADLVEQSGAPDNYSVVVVDVAG